MSVEVQLRTGQTPLPAAYANAILGLEVEESFEQPGTLMLRLPANRMSSGELQFVGDGTLEPMTNVTLTASRSFDPGATAARPPLPQCLFDGYVLSWRLRHDPVAPTFEVWAQDASWLMNLDDKVAEWSGLNEPEIANAIFKKYGFVPYPGNLAEIFYRGPEGRTVVQRSTDLEFLRGLARRTGRLLRVACGRRPGQRIGYFAAPNLASPPAATISVPGPGNEWSVDALEFDWDTMRPTEVRAGQADLSRATGGGVDEVVTRSGFAVLGERSYSQYFGRSSTLRLTASADVPELRRRATGVLAESDFFARCTGEADADRLGAILRVGDLVRIEGAGRLHSGNWLVWTVRHRALEQERWTMSFTLVRNAVGNVLRSGLAIGPHRSRTGAFAL